MGRRSDANTNGDRIMTFLAGLFIFTIAILAERYIGVSNKFIAAFAWIKGLVKRG